MYAVATAAMIVSLRLVRAVTSSYVSPVSPSLSAYAAARRYGRIARLVDRSSMKFNASFTNRVRASSACTPSEVTTSAVIGVQAAFP